jgi:MFS transporter, ACS family, pantothenate transporter
VIDSFIIDGIITMPIALYGFLVFPDVPATTKAFYLSEEVISSVRYQVG